MLRASLRCISLSVVVILAACTGSSDENRRSSPTRHSAVTTTSTIPSSSGTSPSSPSSQSSPPRPLVAESDGWRLVLISPSPGATVGRSVRLCFELSGGTREPVAALIVSLRRAGAEPVASKAVDTPVGRGSARATFPDVPLGPASLEVQLQADGRVLGGVRFIVPVVIGLDAPAETCS